MKYQKTTQNGFQGSGSALTFDPWYVPYCDRHLDSLLFLCEFAEQSNRCIYSPTASKEKYQDHRRLQELTNSSLTKITALYQEYQVRCTVGREATPQRAVQYIYQGREHSRHVPASHKQSECLLDPDHRSHEVCCEYPNLLTTLVYSFYQISFQIWTINYSNSTLKLRNIVFYNNYQVLGFILLAGSIVVKIAMFVFSI